MQIVLASERHLEPLTVLFDQYRQFYKQPKNLKDSGNFVKQRLQNHDSVFLLALNGSDEGLGFTQLYPSFSSVAMKPIWILNDLFVTKPARGNKVATNLLNAAQKYGKQTGAMALKLATGKDNHAAKSLYDKNGWKHLSEFDYYGLSLKK